MFLVQWPKQQKFGELNSQKSSRVNKRGRHPKSLVKSPPSSAAGIYGHKCTMH